MKKYFVVTFMLSICCYIGIGVGLNYSKPTLPEYNKDKPILVETQEDALHRVKLQGNVQSITLNDTENTENWCIETDKEVALVDRYTGHFVRFSK